jgi:hypothetical protein
LENIVNWISFRNGGRRRTNLEIELIIKGFDFSNIYWIRLPIVLLFITKSNSGLIMAEKKDGKKPQETIRSSLTCKTFFWSSLESSNAFTTSQEHLKSSISVPIWFHR